MAFKTSDGRWRGSKWIDGKRQTKRFRTKTLAETWEAAKRYEKENPGHTLEARKFAIGKCEAITFGEFCQRWLADYCRVEKAPSQWVEDGKAIRTYLLPAFGEKRLSALRKGDLQALRGALAARLKPKTVNNVVGLAKRILAVAVDWDVMPATPWSGVKPLPLGEQAVSYWTAAERDAFLEAAGTDKPELADLVTVAAHTGLRRGELAGLTWAQIDFDARLVTIDAVYCFKVKRRVGRTKNRTAAVVPINGPALATLQRIREQGRLGPVFDTVLCHQANDRLRRICKRLGLKRIRFHDLRHTFGSTLAMAGVEFSQRQRLMRHKTAAMTDRYTHLSPQFLRAAVDSIAGADLAPPPQGGPASYCNSRGVVVPAAGLEPAEVISIRRIKTTA